MRFSEALNSTFRSNYGDFSGRASRSEYWYFYLFLLLCVLGIGLFNFVFSELLSSLWIFSFGGVGALLAVLVGLVFIFVAVVPSLALITRRLHDIGLSGWWYVAYVLGSIFLTSKILMEVPYPAGDIAEGLMSLAILAVTVWPSNGGPNKYGENPHAKTDASTFE